VGELQLNSFSLREKDGMRGRNNPNPHPPLSHREREKLVHSVNILKNRK